jgi:phytoene synthase
MTTMSSNPDPILDAAYAHCDAVTRREGSNFAWGFRFLAPDERRAMTVLYAFARATDDLVDEDTLPVEERRAAVAAWRTATSAVLDGGKVADPKLIALGAVARAYALPREELLLLIEGCEEDLSVRRYATWRETTGYCRKVAGTVGLAMLAIFRADPAMREPMLALGLAFQLTNILRDVPEDLRRDRIYLPMEEMKRFGVTRETLANGSPGARQLLEAVAVRAEHYYDAARPLYAGLTPDASRTMKVMARIYRGLIDEMRGAGFDVWTRRPRLSTPRKIAIIARTWIGF